MSRFRLTSDVVKDIQRTDKANEVKRLGPVWLHRSPDTTFVGCRGVGVAQFPRTAVGRLRLRRKVLGARTAVDDPLWAEVVEVPASGPVGSIWSPWLEMPPYPRDLVGSVMLPTLATRIESRPGASAIELVDFGSFERVLERSGTAPAVRDHYERALRRIELPLTSSHGDLRTSNIGYHRDGSLALIDWESFAPRSSGLFDLVHYHVEMIPKSATWGEAVGPALTAPPILALGQRFGLSVPNLMLAYVAFRVVRSTQMHEAAATGPPSSIDAKHGSIASAAASDTF